MNARELRSVADLLDAVDDRLSRMERKVDALALWVDDQRALALERRAPDDIELDGIVSAAFGAMGDSVWSVRELMARAAGNAVEAIALRFALEGVGKCDARRLGIFLGQHCVPFHDTPKGLRLECIGTKGGVRSWRVLVVSNPQTEAAC